MAWLDDFRQDMQRHVGFDHKPVLYEALTKQGLWALFQYRAAAAVYRGALPAPARKGPLLGLVVAKKCVEMTTGISIPHTARIGPGLYIPHFRTIVIHGDAVIGRNCTVSHGVTIGAAGRGDRFGVPVIGDNVYVAPNAVVGGRITVGTAPSSAPTRRSTATWRRAPPCSASRRRSSTIAAGPRTPRTPRILPWPDRTSASLRRGATSFRRSSRGSSTAWRAPTL